TCRTLYHLSIERSIYWRSAKFVHGLLPRVAPLSTFGGRELRETAIKSTNLEWKWEDPSPRLVRRVPIPILYRKERYFIPPGSRWLFQCGHKSSNDQTRWLSVYDLITETVVGSWCLEVTEGYPIFSGESVEPNLEDIDILPRSSKVGLYTAQFTQTQSGEISVKFEKTDEIIFKQVVRFCTLEEGVIAAGNPFEVLVQRWDIANSRRYLNSGAEWLQAGVQIAKDRLITLEVTGVQDDNRMWRINVFDISSVRNAKADQVIENQPLDSIVSASLPNAPCAPFYAPYWEDRVDQAGIHFGFKIMLRMHTSIGERLWHCDFRLDSQLVGDEMQEVLTVEEPNIIGEEADQRPTQFTNGYVLGPKASRI
ncbi:16839_t:CDS:2, partial [Acaulospora colombiana]